MNKQDRIDGYSALHLACMKNNIKVIKWLLRCGANTKLKDLNGLTALHYTVKYKYENATNLLLDNDRNSVNTEDSNRMLPLHYAVQEGISLDIIKKLIEPYPDPNVRFNINCKDDSGFTPLYYALALGRIDVVMEFFKDKRVIETIDTQNNITNAMHIAAAKGYVAVVERLSPGQGESKAIFDAQDENKRTPLHLAIMYGHNGEENKSTALPLVAMSGQNEDENKSTALSLVAMSGHNEDKNKEIPLPLVVLPEHNEDRNKEIPLPLVAISGHNENGNEVVKRYDIVNHKEIVNHLIKSGAAIDIPDVYGKTALHIAVENNNIGAVELLLEAGADFDKEDYFGKTPLEYSYICGSIEVRQKILDYLGKNKDKNIEVGLKTKMQKAFKQMSESKNDQTIISTYVSDIEKYIEDNNKDKLCKMFGLDPEGEIDRSWVPLHYVSMANIPEVVKVLLANNCPVDIRAEDGTTPLHIAAAFGSINVIKMLIEKGADTCLKNNKGKTFWDLASQELKTAVIKKIRNNEEYVNKTILSAIANNSLEALKFLLESGLTYHPEKDEFTSSIVHMAAKYGTLEIIEYLTQKEKPYNTVDKNGFKPADYALIRCFAKTPQEFEGFVRSQGSVLDQLKQQIRENIQTLPEEKIASIEFLLRSGGDLTLVNYAVTNTVPRLKIARDTSVFNKILLSGDVQELRGFIQRCNAKELEEYINAVDLKGNTPIFYAINRGSKEIVEELTKHGVRLNIANKEGITPLCNAIQNSSYAIVKLIVDSGRADLNAEGKNNSMLHYAMLRKTSNGDFERKSENSVAALLLEKGVRDYNLETMNKE